MAHQGKRVGSRRKAVKSASVVSAPLLGLAVGVTLAVVAWGYLVYAAIDFGTTARAGDSTAWWFLALASIGAVACLFAGLMLISRLMRRLGPSSGAPPASSSSHSSPVDTSGVGEAPVVPRPPGGRRAAR